MKPYTVILLRPDYMADDTGTDVYVGHVTAKDEYAAIPIAQMEVFQADAKIMKALGSPEDYALVNVFEGHPKPLLWSWML